MTLQTDSKCLPVIQKKGCYVATLAAMVEAEAGRVVAPEVINRAYTFRSQLKMSDNCYLSNPDLVANFFCEHIKLDRRLVMVGSQVEGQPPQFWGWVKGTAWHYCAIQYLTPYGRAKNPPEASYHFTAGNHDGDEFFNPDPTVKTEGVYRRLLFRVVPL